ncbi:MAG: hypothetical protein R8M11_01285 [Gallionella sp.]
MDMFELLVTCLLLVTASLVAANLAGGLSGPTRKRLKVLMAGTATVLVLSACGPDEPPPAEQAKMEPATEISPEHEKMINDLAARLEQNPEDGRGWSMLARTYAVSKRYSDAVNAYEKAANLIQDDAVMLVDYADILAMVNGKTFKGRPLELIEMALKIDPNIVKGLALRGSAAFEMGDYSGAAAYWGKLLPMLPPNSPLLAQTKKGIENAHTMATRGQSQPLQAQVKKEIESANAMASKGQSQPVSTGARISGVVELSPKLAQQVAPTDTLYVFAKAVSGPPMPVAVIRTVAKDLPLKFVLDDSMAMMPSMKLSSQQQVTVSAKISKSGSATPKSGDLKGEVSPVKLGAENVRVVIDSIVP